jgi:hypothetical protein
LGAVGHHHGSQDQSGDQEAGADFSEVVHKVAPVEV